MFAGGKRRHADATLHGGPTKAVRRHLRELFKETSRDSDWSESASPLPRRTLNHTDDDEEEGRVKFESSNYERRPSNRDQRPKSVNSDEDYDMASITSKSDMDQRDGKTPTRPTITNDRIEEVNRQKVTLSPKAEALKKRMSRESLKSLYHDANNASPAPSWHGASKQSLSQKNLFKTDSVESTTGKQFKQHGRFLVTTQEINPKEITQQGKNVEGSSPHSLHPAESLARAQSAQPPGNNAIEKTQQEANTEDSSPHSLHPPEPLPAQPKRRVTIGQQMLPVKTSHASLV